MDNAVFIGELALDGNLRHVNGILPMADFARRQGFQKLLEATNIKAMPQHVQEPRHNPYIFWKEEEVEGGWDRDINEFRKHHLR